MTDQPTQPRDMTKELTEIAERSQNLVKEFLARTASEGTQLKPDGEANFDPSGLGRAFLEMTQRMMSNPAKMVEAQNQLWQSYMQLWAATTRRMMGAEAEPVATPEKGDRRFQDTEWSENFVFDYIKQSYLLAAQWILNNVEDVEFPDDHTRGKVNFYARQFVDAMAPTNFVATNPAVLKETIESRGE